MMERARYMSHRHLLLPLAAAVMLGCSSADEPDRVVSDPVCRDGTGQVVECNLELPEPGSFVVTLTGTSCDATNNTVRTTSPVNQVLLDDACNAALGQTWEFDNLDAGATISLQIESDDVGSFPTGLRITGTYPQWVASFEDGFDQDFNDIVMRIDAVVAQ
jgi:hypothetical protein